MLGNLARPSYLKSTEGVWPWSYDTCGTSDEARDARDVQKLNTCQHGQGRGSPEIDIIEAQPGDISLPYTGIEHVDGRDRDFDIGRPMISSSLQLSPGVARDIRPLTPDLPTPGQWYPDLYPMGGPAYGNVPSADNETIPRMLNNYWYGQVINENPQVWQDGLSVNWQHSESYYSQQTIIRTEWQAGKDDGYVRWFSGDGELIYEITADMLKQKPGASDAIPQIPYEAMYLILNTDISPRWGWNGCDPTNSCIQQNPDLCTAWSSLTCHDCADPQCLRCPTQTGWLADFCEDVNPQRPAEYLIDYIRVYQDATDPLHTVGCSPQQYPTKSYIEDNWQKYTFNPYKKKEPLKVVRHGGGDCVSDSDCGNVLALANKVASAPIRRSFCVSGRCQCPTDWTGPNCLVPCVGEYANCDGSSNLNNQSSAEAKRSTWMLVLGAAGAAVLLMQ